MDPLQHPDLIDIGRRLRARMEGTLDAELEAARAAAARRRTMRDILLEAEDARSRVRVHTIDGGAHTGQVASVGVDHLIVGPVTGPTTAVTLATITSIEVDR